MRATATSSLTDTVANTVFVDTVGDFFQFKAGSTLTPVSNVVVASSDGLGQWHRMGIRNQTFLAASFWAVDPANSTGLANDENAGWGATQAAARLVPLLTIEELNRRLVGSVISRDVVFEQLSSFAGPQNGQLTNLRTENGNGYPVWMGKKTAIFTGVISAYSAETPASNTRTMITATGLGAAHVGKLIMNAAGTKSAWVQKDLGGGQVGVTLPTAGIAEPYVIGQATFTVGETISVYTLPTIYNYPFPQSCLYPALTWVNWSGGYAADQMAGSRPGIFGVSCSGLACTGSAGVFDGCLFSGNVFVTGCGNVTLQNCGIRNGTFTALDSLIGLNHQTIDIQNGTLLLTGSSTLFGGTTTTGIAAFDCTGTTPGSGSGALVIQRGGGAGKIKLAPTGKIYGSGNTTHLVAVAVGTQSTVPAAAGCTATTSATKPLLVEGVEYAYADMPIRTADFTGLNNVDA